MHVCNGSSSYKFLASILNIQFLEKVASSFTVELTLEFIFVINKLRMAITNDVLDKFCLWKFPIPPNFFF